MPTPGLFVEQYRKSGNRNKSHQGCDVTIIACGADSRGYLVEAVTPPEGEVTFYLAKKTGDLDYGTSTSGQGRVSDSGDCP